MFLFFFLFLETLYKGDFEVEGMCHVQEWRVFGFIKSSIKLLLLHLQGTGGQDLVREQMMSL